MLFQFGNRSAAIINKVVVLLLVFVVVDGANGLNETETKSWPIRNKQTKKQQQQQGQYLSSIEQVWSIKDLFKVNLLSRKQQGEKKSRAWCTWTVVVLFTKPIAFWDVLVTVAVVGMPRTQTSKVGKTLQNGQDVASLSFFSFPWSLTLYPKTFSPERLHAGGGPTPYPFIYHF